MFLLVFRQSVVTFYVDPKSKIAALATDSQERLQGSTFTSNLPQMFLMGPDQVLLLFHMDPKSKMAALASDWLTHFLLFLKNGCGDPDLLQTWRKCSL